MHLGSFIFSFFCLTAAAEALIVETNDFADVLNYLEKDTLYCVDLDNTVFETVQLLGSDQWFTYELARLMKEGKGIDAALSIVAPCYNEVQLHTEMQLVDAEIPYILSQVQGENVAVMGLTKRVPFLAERTLYQLGSLQIDFSQMAPDPRKITLENLQGTVIEQGILFTAGGVDKGPALVSYLDYLPTKPQQIVAIDDKLSHLQGIANMVEPLGIRFVGIRYGKTDAKVKAYNPQVAEVQMQHFKKILSDEEALRLLQ